MTETMVQEANKLIDLVYNPKFNKTKEELFEWLEKKVDNIIPLVKEFKNSEQEKEFVASFLPYLIQFSQNSRLEGIYVDRYEILQYLIYLKQQFSFVNVQILLRNDFVLLGNRNIVSAYKEPIQYVVNKDFDGDWDEFFLRLPDILPYDIEFDYVDAIVDFYCKKNDLVLIKFSVDNNNCYLVQKEETDE